MRTYEEIIIDYEILKAVTLYRVTKDPVCLDFVTPEDANEIINWDPEVAEEIVSDLTYYLQEWGKDTSDGNLNPWCLYQKLSYNPDCRECSFTKRHGYCHAVQGSLYADFLNKYGPIHKVLFKDLKFIENALEILDPNKFRDPQRLIVNLTQHPSTPEQGVVDLKGGKLDDLKWALTFNKVLPKQKIINRADFIANLAINLGLGDEEDGSYLYAAMIGGAPYLMSALEQALRERDIVPLYAFSERESVEEKQPDGTVKKISVFRHKGFVRV